jgi:hypothetical protein
MSKQLISLATLKELTDAGARPTATAIASPIGWTAFVQIGNRESALASVKTKQVRSFNKLDALISVISSAGIKHVHVDATGFSSQRTNTPAGTKRAAVARVKMQAIHDQASHSRWLAEKIEAGRADTRPVLTHAQVKAQATERRLRALRGEAP